MREEDFRPCACCGICDDSSKYKDVEGAMYCKKCFELSKEKCNKNPSIFKLRKNKQHGSAYHCWFYLQQNCSGCSEYKK